MFAWINRPQIPITTRQSVKTSIVVIRAALLSGGCNHKKLPLLLRRENRRADRASIVPLLGNRLPYIQKTGKRFLPVNRFSRGT